MNLSKPIKPPVSHTRRFAVTLLAVVACLTQAGCANLKAPRLFGNANRQSAKSAETLTASEAVLRTAFARGAERRGEWKQALTTYQSLVDANHGSAEIHHRIALIQGKQGNAAEEEKHFQESLKLNPTDSKVLCDYGYSLYLRQSWEAAEMHYHRAITADPQYARAHVNLGLLLARTNRFEEALYEFASGGLTEAAAHHNIALVAAEAGDLETAVAAINVSQSAEPNSDRGSQERELHQVIARLAARK